MSNNSSGLASIEVKRIDRSKYIINIVTRKKKNLRQSSSEIITQHIEQQAIQRKHEM